MAANNLLDNDFLNNWGNHIIEEKDIIWKGSPEKKFSVSILEKNYYHDVATGATSPLTIFIVLFGSAIFLFFKAGFLIGSIIIAIVALIALFGQDIFNYFSKSKTAYAITKDKVLFKLSKWGKEKIHVIPFSNIHKTTYQEHPNGHGTIYFFTNQPAKFKTYNFDNGEMRHHPTFEMIPNVIEIQKKIEEVRKDAYTSTNRSQQYVYKKKPVNLKLLKATKIIQNIILIYFTLFALDFYFAPVKTITDSGHSRSLNTDDDYEDNGAKHKTNSGLTFGTYTALNLNGKTVIITHTIFFKTVKDVIYNGNSLKHILGSGFFYISKYFYLFTFIVILIGRFLLTYEAHLVDQEYLMKVIIFNGVVFLIVYYHIFSKYN